MNNYDKVYATVYNLKKILGATNVDEVSLDRKIIYDSILNRPLYLPKQDWETIKKLYIFLENPEVYIKEYFKGWKDTFTYLIEEPPAYHISKSCQYLLNDFYNVAIPQKLKKNKEWIAEAREYAYQNRSKINPKQIESFKEGFIRHFVDKIFLTNNDLNTIDLKNSGAEFVDNNIEGVKLKIENLFKNISEKFTLVQMNFYQREFSNNRYWYKGEYGHYGSYLEHVISSNLNYIRNSYVNPLVKNLSSYIILKLNPNNEYEQNILDFLNFRPCDGCSGGRSKYIRIATL